MGNLGAAPVNRRVPALHAAIPRWNPPGLVLPAGDKAAMTAIARAPQARPTMDRADATQARRLLPPMQCKARRALANGFPAGVGTLSIRRFLWPVCYHNLDLGVLPASS